MDKAGWLRVLGMLPPLNGVDRETAHRTVLKVWQTWDWKSAWGWDFPWMAMAAARVGEPQLALGALLKDAGDKNRYGRVADSRPAAPEPPRLLRYRRQPHARPRRALNHSSCGAKIFNRMLTSKYNP